MVVLVLVLVVVLVLVLVVLVLVVWVLVVDENLSGSYVRIWTLAVASFPLKSPKRSGITRILSRVELWTSTQPDTVCHLSPHSP